METDDDIMTAEEFFGGLAEQKKAPRKSRSRAKKPEAILAAVKVKMVMRIHGVSRAEALQIIAKREAEKKAAEAEEAAREQSGYRGDRLMSAREFFGEEI
jgi:hypothetical protein